MLGVGDSEACLRQALMRSRVKGFIFNRDGSWHVNGRSVGRAIRRVGRRRRAPSPRATYGLGELCARTSVRLELPMAVFQRLKSAEVKKLLYGATEIARRQIPPSPIAEIGASEALKQPHLTPDLVRLAVAFVRYPPLARFGLYGLHAVIDVLLHVRPRMLGRWIVEKQVSEINQMLLAHLSRRLTFGRSNESIFLNVLRTKVPLLQAMVATSLVDEHPLNAPSKTFSELMTIFEDAGMQPLEAFVLSMAAAGAGGMWRMRVRDRARNAEQRLVILRADPNAAVGGAQYADEEIERFANELAESAKQVTASEDAVDELVRDIALAWPDHELPDTDLELVKKAFAFDMAEFSTRIAQQMRLSPARTQLLDEVIQRMFDYLGLDVQSDVFDNYFFPESTEFPVAAGWTSRAIGLRYEQGPLDAGHATARTLSALAKASAAVLNAPYAAARRPVQYQAALTRRACSVWFAMRVACGETSEEKSKRVKLMSIALGEARATLCRDRSDMDTKGWTFRLAQFAVQSMAKGDCPDTRGAWSQDLSLPDFVRALVIWSDIGLIRNDLAKAEQLFVAVGTRKTYLSESLEGLKQGVTLLDLAIATCVRNCAIDAEQMVLDVWPKIFDSWRSVADARFQDIHLHLFDAARNDGALRRKFLADPMWMGSVSLEPVREAERRQRPPHAKAPF